MFLHDSHSHRSEIGTEYLIRIRIIQKFGSPNIPSTHTTMFHDHLFDQI